MTNTFFELEDGLSVSEMENSTGQFGTGRILFRELELVQVSKFEKIWCTNEPKNKSGTAFYRPIGVPAGYFSLGHYCQSHGEKAIRGWIIAVKERQFSNFALESSAQGNLPPLARPLHYALVWKSQNWRGNLNSVAYFWLPKAPDEYRACGFVVTTAASQPSLDEVRCVRTDLTETCETDYLIFRTGNTNSQSFPFSVWNMRPQFRGAKFQGISAGTFYCFNNVQAEAQLSVSCLKNVDMDLSAMPNLRQMHYLIKRFGPVVVFHPDETFFPSSVSWLFENGQLLHKRDGQVPHRIASDGSNLPLGGTNDKEYWLDFPKEEATAKRLKRGDLQSAEAYIHFKPALGATFTDIVMWLFYPFNGPVTVKIGAVNLPLTYGEHVGDWEHFTLRVSNFTGELWKVYFSQHRRGQWIDAIDLECTGGSKITVYAAKSGHAVFPRPGNYLEGDRKLGIGIRNDACRSKYCLDTSNKYQIVSAEHLQLAGSKDVVTEPYWLQYMRQWGPNVNYHSTAEMNKVFRLLPSKIRSPIQRLLNNLPKELSREQGPTGPKAKDNWYGDERG